MGLYDKVIVLENQDRHSKRVIDSWNYITQNAKLIQNKKRRECFRRLLNQHSQKLLLNPASVKYHHNKSGGLAIHTAQVLRRALQLHGNHRIHMLNITSENVYIVAVLHDLAKTQHYELDDTFSNHPYPFKYSDGFNMEHDIWSIAVANSFGLNLSYDEMMGIMQAHGGWAKLNEPINKLAVIIHCADMLSSQIVKK